MTNEKHFLKTISQREFNYGLFTNLPTTIAPHDFLRVYSNSKDVSYLSWQNTYPNLKTTCHIKLKCFLWTKLLEILLLAKYLISVTAPLKAHFVFKIFKFLFWLFGHAEKGPIIMVRLISILIQLLPNNKVKVQVIEYYKNK